jgi:hypothetical protein
MMKYCLICLLLLLSTPVMAGRLEFAAVPPDVPEDLKVIDEEYTDYAFKAQSNVLRYRASSLTHGPWKVDIDSFYVQFLPLSAKNNPVAKGVARGLVNKPVQWDSVDVAHHVKENSVALKLMINSSAAQDTFQWRLNTNYTPVQNDDGSISLSDSVVIHKPYAVDANGDSLLASMWVDGPVDGYYTITKYVDHKSAVHPVEADPAITVTGGTGVNEVWMYANGRSTATAASAVGDKFEVGTIGGAARIDRSFQMFDLSGISGDTVTVDSIYWIVRPSTNYSDTDFNMFVRKGFSASNPAAADYDQWDGSPNINDGSGTDLSLGWPSSGFAGEDQVIGGTAAGADSVQSYLGSAFRVAFLSDDDIDNSIVGGNSQCGFLVGGGDQARLVIIYASDPPDAPTNIATTKGTQNDHVAVTWTASSGATSYSVFRADSASGTPDSIGTISASPYNDSTASAPTANPPTSVAATTTLEDTIRLTWDAPTVTDGASYWYWVKAVSAEGSSALSDSGDGAGYRDDTVGNVTVDSTITGNDAWGTISGSKTSPFNHITIPTGTSIDYALKHTSTNGYVSTMSDTVTGLVPIIPPVTDLHLGAIDTLGVVTLPTVTLDSITVQQGFVWIYNQAYGMYLDIDGTTSLDTVLHEKADWVGASLAMRIGEINQLYAKTTKNDTLYREDYTLGNIPGGGGAGTIIIEEADGTPSVAASVLKINNGSLTASGDTATVDMDFADLSGTASQGQVPVADSSRATAIADTALKTVAAGITVADRDSIVMMRNGELINAGDLQELITSP